MLCEAVAALNKKRSSGRILNHASGRTVPCLQRLNPLAGSTQLFQHFAQFPRAHQSKRSTSNIVDDGLVNVVFGTPVMTTPAVFTSVNTANGADAVTARVSNVSVAGFSVALQEQESKVDGHKLEQIGWIAITQGIGTTADGRSIEVGTFNASNSQSTYTFAIGVNRVHPVVIGAMSSLNGPDPATTTQGNLSNTSVQMFIQEEQSADQEVIHTSETISITIAE